MSSLNSTDKSQNNSKEKKPNNNFTRFFFKGLWISFQLLLIVSVSLGFLAAGGVTGYVASKVKGMPTPSKEEIREKVNEGWQIGYAYFDDNSLIGQLRAEENRKTVELEEISPFLIDAFIATEDRRFFEHPGVNAKAAARAVVQNLQAGGIVSGFSTITQQLARNTFLSNTQTTERKVREIFLALRMERALSKNEILTAYLNKIYFGKDANGYNLYGVEAAAKSYFGVSAADLNLPQAAVIAGLPQNPIGYSLYNNLDAALDRQAMVLKNLLDTNFISQKEHDDALKFNIKASLQRPELKAYSKYPFVMMETEDRAAELLVAAGLYDNKNDALYSILSSGMHIYTTIDPDLQAIVDDVVTNPDNFMENIDYQHPLTGQLIEDALQDVGVTMLDSNSGAILAFAGGRDFTKSQVNHTKVLRQPGSAIKPLVIYGPAVESKLVMPGTVVDDAPFVRSDPSADSGLYFPQNVDKTFHGLLTARVALNNSWNIPALKFFEQVTPQVGASFLEDMGITTLSHGDKHNLATGLGGLEIGVSVEEMTGAFATFANNGVFNQTFLIKTIKDSNGNIIYQHELEPRTVFSEQTSYIMNNMLTSVVKSGTASTVRRNIPERELAGKTGTTDESKDLWFFGYTPEIVTGVFVGFDIPHPMALSERPRAQIIYSEIMREVFDNFPDRFPANSSFKQPANIVSANISTKSGKLANELVTAAGWAVTEIFVKGTEPVEEDDLVLMADFVEVEGKKYLPSPLTPEAEIQTGYFFVRPVPYELPDDDEKHKPLDADYELPTEFDPRFEHNEGAVNADDLKVVSHSDNSVSLTWQVNSAVDFGGYILERRTLQNDFFEAVHPGYLGDNFYIDPNVDSYTSYIYRVTSYAQDGQVMSVSNTVTIRPGLYVPKAPTGLTIEDSSMGIKLHWEESPSEDQVNRYRIYRADNTNGPFYYIAAVPTNEFTDFSANSNFDFWYRISAENDSGESLQTAKVTLVKNADNQTEEKPIEPIQPGIPDSNNGSNTTNGPGTPQVPDPPVGPTLPANPADPNSGSDDNKTSNDDSNSPRENNDAA